MSASFPDLCRVDETDAGRVLLIDPFTVYGDAVGDAARVEITVPRGVLPPEGRYVGVWGAETLVVATIQPPPADDGPTIAVSIEPAARGCSLDVRERALEFVGWLGPRALAE